MTMESEILDDKLTIKSILFTKALPNYTIPIPTTGYKIFPCTDCGDRFLLESSYNHHINRKSLKITYLCKQCKKHFIFNNRCKLLHHIRSHAFKFATIYISDLNIEPLPVEDFNCLTTQPPEATKKSVDVIEKKKRTKKYNKCFECNELIDQSITFSTALSKHYMRHTNEIHTCPICLFSVPNTCTLSAHLRLHLKIPPFFCPECGIKLSNQPILYPYHHDCEGFKMMRATIRIQCKLKSCNKIFHPSDYVQHIRTHCKKLNVTPHNSEQVNVLHVKSVGIFECPICLKKLSKQEINVHISRHLICIIEQNNFQVYTCNLCKLIFMDVKYFLKHHIAEHKTSEKTLSKFLSKPDKDNPNGFYRVVKRCDKCLLSVVYRCELKAINTLPSECPYKCSQIIPKNDRTCEGKNHIICGLCKDKINEDWKNVKAHFALFHKNHKCLDLKLTLHKIEKNNFGTILTKYKNVKCVNGIRKKKLKYNVINVPLKYEEKKITDESEDQNENSHILRCKMCNFMCQEKKTFEEHIIIHRDPCMAYQCLECGQCFMVKASFSTHLLLEHSISDICDKHCYNKLAFSKHQNNNSVEDEPVKENQCAICRHQFDNSHDLEKHFRVHGMAFLMKRKSNSP